MSSGNTYEIYEQDIPEIDMYSHLPRWLSFYELALGRKLRPEDKVFPFMAVNGIIDPSREMSYELFSKLLHKFTDAAGLEGWYTTHSFRRGGAQYRFIFAPLGFRWSLNRVRWWGGWAEGESVDTLMKYLMDSLQSYENGHGDALQPVPKGAEASFMGEHLEMQAATGGEVREMKRSVDRRIDEIDQKLDEKMDELVVKITAKFEETHLPSMSLSSSASGVRRAKPTVRAARVVSAPYVNRSPSVSSDEYSSGSSDDGSSLSESKPKPLPIPGVKIPHLGPGANAWKRALKQWEQGDPASGLLPLKDWPTAYYTNSMRTVTGTKRRDRELVAIAYNQVGRDEDAFLAAYPEANKSLRSLIRAIRRDRKIAKPRASRNGTPEEREARRVAGG
ncbi:hypothetical protein Hypma_000596 [Hypsizygus marmoreus]|uniref:Tyr recombinase domain-containing protein n=1 Tax=Hypsizygus marmoreus TaxID=39966 RepID=A0A369J8K1_HYPMA|nr:hypothetical protein Hypma_000596 [Hypsizygus marmoreus]